MGMEGWQKLEARDDQDLGHAVSRATALDGQRSGKTAVCRLPYAERGCSSRQERAKRGATHPVIRHLHFENISSSLLG